MSEHQPNPAPSQNGWTFISLKAYLEGLIIANDRRYEQRFVDSQTAVAAALAAVKLGADAALVAQKESANKTEQASERRFEQARIEADQRMGELSRQIGELKGADREFGGRRIGAKEAWGYIIAFLTILAALFVKRGP